MLFLRRALSLAFLAAILAAASPTAFSRIIVVICGFCSQKSVSFSFTRESTYPRTSEFPSLVFVCPSNCGSGIFNDKIAVSPTLTSSPVSFSSLSSFLRSFSFFSRNLFKTTVSAILKPSR